MEGGGETRPPLCGTGVDPVTHPLPGSTLSLSSPFRAVFSAKKEPFNRMCHISGAGSLAAFWLRAGEMRAGWWGERKSNNFFFFSKVRYSFHINIIFRLDLIFPKKLQ